MIEVEKFVKEYFMRTGIPLYNNRGSSNVIMCVYGANKAGRSGGATKWLNKWFPDRPQKCKVYTHILYIEGKKYCFKCKKVKQLKDFSEYKYRQDKKQQKCKNCSKISSREWAKNNRASIANTAARRRAEKLNRTPEWGNKEKIKFFYECCPRDCHVDHVVPLKGKNISGLHIETNLQWLPAKENQRKSNKWES